MTQVNGTAQDKNLNNKKNQQPDAWGGFLSLGNSFQILEYKLKYHQFQRREFRTLQKYPLSCVINYFPSIKEKPILSIGYTSGITGKKQISSDGCLDLKCPSISHNMEVCYKMIFHNSEAK